MADEKGVKLHGLWLSPFSLRVEWALKLKGVQYEFINEDIRNKSPDLLRYNPVYKKVPVLLHDGKPLAESAVIVEYIDETWKEDYPLLPKDPYERAVARFWAKFADDKIGTPVNTYAYSTSKEEERKKAAEDLEENLRVLSGVLKGRKFFGGDSIGYLDIVAGWIPFWVQMLKEVYGLTLDLDQESLAEFKAWADRFLAVDLVERLPPWEKFIEWNRKYREKQLQAAAN